MHLKTFSKIFAAVFLGAFAALLLHDAFVSYQTRQVLDLVTSTNASIAGPVRQPTLFADVISAEMRHPAPIVQPATVPIGTIEWSADPASRRTIPAK